ncbi:MAG: ABC transporter permease [Vulcanimicrobiaceae bacterium]
MSFASPAIAIVLTVVVGCGLFWALGKNPLTAFYTFFVAPISGLNGVAELFLKASPLMLIAMGLAVGFRANVWNIGAEGQLTIGAIAAGGIALRFYGSQSLLILPAMIVAGALGGMAWAAIPALLRTRFNANEILTSLMLTYVAGLLLNYLVHGPWRDPQGYNFPQSLQFTASELYPILVPGTRLNASVLIALGAIVAGWAFVEKSFVGYQMRVAGLAGGAARYAGFSLERTVWIGMLAGGAAAGLAGVGEVAGPIGQLLSSVSPGYGFAAIIVAFVGRLHPLGIVLASLLMSLLYLGGEQAQMSLNLPPAIAGMFEGMLLFFLLGADVFVNYRLKRKKIGRSPAASAA